MTARQDPSGATSSGAPSRANHNRRHRTEPTCPLPADQPHNSVRAGRRGCTCPGAVEAHRRDLGRRVPSPIPRVRREPPGAPVPTHVVTPLERALRARDDLACRLDTCGHDPELWFPTGTGELARQQELDAKRICARCPALGMCAPLALQLAPTDGVMGGYSPEDRRAIRAARTEQDAA